ncbi:MAG: tetratricopeptide repeat protein [Pseudothermotoga sp.]
MKRVSLAVVILLSICAFAGVIDKVGKDPEQSWEELIKLIKTDPDSTVILSEGPKISAKRRLARFESLRDAIVDEDFDRFLKDLASSADSQVDLSRETFLVFPQLRDTITAFEKGNFEDFEKLKGIWKIGIKVLPPSDFGHWIVDRFLKDPYAVDWNLVAMLKSSENAGEISQQIVDRCFFYQNQEQHFPSLYRLFEIANQLSARQLSEFEKKLSTYMELLNTVSKFEPSRLNSSEFYAFLMSFDNLAEPKEEIKKRLVFLIQSAKKMGVELAYVETKDESINSLLRETKKVSPTKIPNWIWVLIGVMGGISLFLFVDRLRLNFLLFFRMRKPAIKLCKKILTKRPSDLSIRFKLAMLYEQIGKVDEAIKEYQCIKDLSKMLRSPQEKGR